MFGKVAHAERSKYKPSDKVRVGLATIYAQKLYGVDAPDLAEWINALLGEWQLAASEITNMVEAAISAGQDLQQSKHETELANKVQQEWSKWQASLLKIRDQ